MVTENARRPMPRSLLLAVGAGLALSSFAIIHSA